MRKRYSELTEEQKEKRREAVKRHSKRKHAEAAIAAGREPFVPGRPREFSDEERLERRRIAIQKYKDANAEWLRADAARRGREKRRAKAIAMGREPAKSGHRYSVKPRTKEERLALRRKIHAERYRKKASAKARADYAANPEKFIERQRKLKLENPEKYRAYKATGGRNRRARAGGNDGKHKSADIEFLWTAQKGHCVFCLKPLIRGKFHVDHHVPLALGGSNDRSNLRLLHRKCNLEKSWRDPIEHAREHGMLFW